MPIIHRMTAEAIIDQLSQSKPTRANIIPPELNVQILARKNLLLLSIQNGVDYLIQVLKKGRPILSYM